MSLPEVVPREKWLQARRRLLAQETEFTEMPGYSCFLREGGEVFHTYSVYGRGTEYVGSTYTLLDLTALGRQEDWEEPKGRSQSVRSATPDFAS